MRNKMKRILLTIAVCVLMAAPALASPTITVGRTPGTYPITPALSGEFTLTPNPDLMAITAETGPFQSFCLEVHEDVTIGNTYEVILNDEAILGDGRWPGEFPGSDGGDLLDPNTAYLYTQFRAGTLVGYDYLPGPGRESSALALQTAIWYIEYEIGYTNYSALSPQAHAFVNLANDANWTTIGNVRVLNLYLWDLDTGKIIVKQDMLVLVPAGGDVNSDGKVDFTDLEIMAFNWVEENCSYPNWCEGADLNYSGRVDLVDFAIFAEHWLEGTGH